MRRAIFLLTAVVTIPILMGCALNLPMTSSSKANQPALTESIVVDGVEQQVKFVDGYYQLQPVFDEWQQTMSEWPKKTEFETSQEFEKRKPEAVKEINYKENMQKNQVYQVLFNYSDPGYSFDNRTFSLKEYDMERGVFPISINRSKWRIDFSWDNDWLRNMEIFPLIFKNMPEGISIPIEDAMKIRQEKSVKLEVNFRITSCREGHSYKPKRFGQGKINERKFTIVARVLSVRLLSHYGAFGTNLTNSWQVSQTNGSVENSTLTSNKSKLLPTPDEIYKRNNSTDEQYYSNTTLYNLRNSYQELSVSQVQSISNISIREKAKWGFYGHSTINHNYEKKFINGDVVVIDYATGLMWHQSGSEKSMTLKKGNKWINKLNNMGYAGYNDWRLPTLEEAASLLEAGKKNGKLYINQIFDRNQSWIMTGDTDNSNGVWRISFEFGRVNTSNLFTQFFLYIRPVRSINRTNEKKENFKSSFQNKSTTQKETLDTIRLNVCENDPDNADYWSVNDVNLFSKPGGLSVAGNKLRCSLPACKNLQLAVLEKRVVNGVEFYRVKHGLKEGWQTKRLLTDMD